MSIAETIKVGRIKLVRHRGVPKWLAAEANALLTRLSNSSPVTHKLKVILAPAVTVGSGEQTGFGVFGWKASSDRPLICVGGYFVRWLQREHGYPQREAVKEFLRTLAHEFVHYEQFRDGKVLTERGVAVRTKSLLETAA